MYCIIKGAEGFGDRLQCLIYALHYCYVSNRTLVVDWRDPHWSQVKYFPINKFIKIKNIEVIDINDFLKERYNKELTVSNKKWYNLIDDDKFINYIYDTSFGLEDDNKIIKDIIDGNQKDFKENIVVYPGVGFRKYYKNYTQNIQFSDEVDSLVNEIYEKYNLIKNNYICIHIRAKSKNWKHKKNMNHKLSRRMDMLFPREERYFENLYKKLQRIEESIPVILVSDCQSTAKRWIDKYKKGILIENEKIQTKECSGIHLVNLENKDEKYKCKLNMLCLRDFCLMKNSKHLISDQISLFSNMAKLFKNDKPQI